jgi:hypothetical protein
MLTFILCLIGAVLFFAWLMAWLQGGWGARFAAFILLSPLIGFTVAASIAPPDSAILMQPRGWLAFLIAIPLAWLASGIPTYLRSSRKAF